MTQPTVSWSDSPVAPVDPGPMISEVPQPAADFVANDYALPQGVSDNGGMATQGGRTFLLRQRTADEDAAYAQQAKDQATNPQNQGITVDKNGIAYGARDMSPGSQGAWEKKQELDEMLNRPFGLKVAKLANDQGTLAETIRNNSMNFGVNQQNANTNTANIGSVIGERNTLLPVKVAEGAAGVGLTRAKTGETIQTTENLGKTGQTIIPLAQSEIGVRGAQVKNLASEVANRDAMTQPEIDLKNATGARESAMAGSYPDKDTIAANTNATNRLKVDETELKTLSTTDPDFSGKFAASGGSLQGYKAANLIASAKGLTFKSKPFKTGVPGFRTTHPAGYYTADGVPVPMSAMVAEYQKRQGGQ